MISIEECRKYLGNDGKRLTDEEVEKLRDSLYRLVGIVLDEYLNNKRSLNPNSRSND